jgi:hypothetical protein
MEKRTKYRIRSTRIARIFSGISLKRVARKMSSERAEHTIISVPGFLLERTPIRMMGTIIEVPAKLILANNANSSPIKEEKSKTIIANIDNAIFVCLKSRFSSLPSNNDLNSDPSANI